MATAWPVLFVLAIIVALMTASFLFVPKGPHQTLIRTALMLTFAACYLMWMATYMAQLHPLMSPQFVKSEKA